MKAARLHAFNAALELDEVPAPEITGPFVGNLVGSYIDLVELIALVAQGKVTSRNRTYPLDAVNDVLNDLQQGRLQGRGILVPDGAVA